MLEPRLRPRRCARRTAWSAKSAVPFFRVGIHRSRNAAETVFLEGLSFLILEYMISNLLTKTGAADDETFAKVRPKIVELIKTHADDAEKFPWVMRLVDPKL
jgi:hypothetical protein